MARIALAAAGAIIGGVLGTFVGNPLLGVQLGLSIGGAVGAILFPGKLPAGPRLNDLIVSTATDGAPIPFGYGQVRVAGNIIWAPPIVETSTTKSVKGGPKQTNYTYTGNFAVAFGEGPGSIGRIWFDSKIVYDPVQGGSNVPITGASWNLITEIATFQSILNPTVGSTVTISGVGSGYDGSWPCQASSSTSFQLFIPGSGLPTLGAGGTAATSGSNAITGVSEIATSAAFQCTLNPPLNSQVTIAGVGHGYDGKYQVIASTPVQFIVFNPTSGLPALGAGGTASFPPPPYPAPIIYSGTETQNADPSIQAFEGAANTPAFRGLIYCVWTNFPLNDFGNRIPNIRAEITYNTVQATYVSGWGTPDGSAQASGNGTLTSVGPVSAGFNTEAALYTANSSTPAPNGPGWVGLPGAGYLKLFSGSTTPQATIGSGEWAAIAAKFQFGPASLFGTVTGVAIDSSNNATCQCTNPMLVNSWVSFSGLSNTPILNGKTGQITAITATSFTAHFTTSLPPQGNVSDNGTATWLPYIQNSGTVSGAGSTITVTLSNPITKGNLIFVFFGSGNPDTHAITSVADGMLNTYNVIQVNDSNGAHAVFAYAYAGSNGIHGTTITLTASGLMTSMYCTATEVPTNSQTARSAGTVPGATLAQMVTDIALRSGLTQSQIDVTRLIGLPAPSGYVITRPSPGQAALKPLADAFFFDGVETNGAMTFVPRGGAAQQITVPESDLGLHKDNYKIVEQIGMAQDLPREIQVLFQDRALDYQQNKSMKRRHTRIVKSRNQTVYELPMTIDSTTARAIAEKALFLAYLERKPYDFNLWKATYLLYDPTDVINFTYEGLLFTMRIMKSTIGQDLQVALSGVNENASSYQSSVAGTSGTGVTPGSVKTLPDTTLFLFDIPLLRDQDSNPSGSGYYFALGSLATKWPGGLLEKSADNVSFSQEDSSANAVSYGYLLNTLGPPPTSPWVWDTVNTFKVFMVNGTLASTTDLNVLDGANAFMIGGECVQAVNAVLNADGSYTCSRLLRGRRGTDTFCNTHGPNELLVYLNNPGVIRHAVGSSDLQVLRYYEGVTSGQTPGPPIVPMLFTNTGKDLWPYAPASLAGSRDGGSNLTLTWIRRTRIGGDWLAGTGTVPLSEATESYDVEILKNGAVVRTFAALSSPTAAYTAAQQVADFGGTQSKVTFNVYQNSAIVGRGFKATATV